MKTFSTFHEMANAVLTSAAAQSIFAHIQAELTPQLLAAGFRIKESKVAPAWRPVEIVRAGDQTGAGTSIQAHDPITGTAFMIDVRLMLLEQSPTRASTLLTVKASHSKPTRVCANLPSASAFWTSSSLEDSYAQACQELVANPLYRPSAHQFEALAGMLSTALMP